MGNSGSANAGHLVQAESEFSLNPLSVFTLPAKSPAVPLRFHARHGDHVEISQDGTVAKRIRSYCKGEGSFGIQ